MSEDDLIAKLVAPLAGPEGLGLRDDAALLTPTPGRQIVVTVDAIVAGVHFFADDPPESIARKALRVNLSDLAAKGATPRGFLLTLALPLEGVERSEAWLGAFAQALGEDSRRYCCPLLGGDTVATSGPLTLSITALGEVAQGRFVPRTGVKPGDALYVSGTVGDAALGLRARRGEVLPVDAAERAFLLDRYLHPQPRGVLAPAMAACASAGMDVSDGLVGDLTKMLRVSGVTGAVDLRKVPFSSAAATAIGADAKWFEVAVTGGDDYELLASVALDKAGDFEAQALRAGVKVTRIGEALAGGAPPTFIGLDGALREFAAGSYSHF